MSKRLLFFLLLLAAFASPSAHGDSPESAMKKLSPFKDFTLAQVEGGDILENRSGASISPQVQAVQTCFLIKAAPSAVAEKIVSWNPAGKPGLEVSKHLKFSPPTGPDTFAGPLSSLFKANGGDAGWLADQSKKATDPSCELLLTADEKKHLAQATTPAKLTAAWAAILAERANGFAEHGAADFHKLEMVVEKLGVGSIPAASGGSNYWEIGDVSDRGSITEGVSWRDSGERTRVFDGEYFVTSEYSASLNVSTLWPVTVKGKTETLVWRVDSGYANQFADQSGAERIASSGLILASTKETIQALRRELEK